MSIFDRVKRAYKAFSTVDPPKEQNEPHYGQVVFLCDHRACKVCSYPNCRHTFDILHAKNFVVSGNGIYWEVDDDDRQEVSR